MNYSELKKLQHGDPYRAYDLAAEHLKSNPDDLVCKQIQAFALAQTGAPGEAVRILTALYDAGNRDTETLGLLGRAWKDIAREAVAPEGRSECLAKARNCYLEGLVHAESVGDSGGYYPGINAATLSLLLGEKDAAYDLAARSAKLAESAPKRDYWSVATLAEAALICGDAERASALYTEASGFAPTPGQVASTRRQARELSRVVFGAADRFDACFQVAPVIVFIGHLTDSPNRAVPRFSDSMVADVESRITAALKRIGASIGFAGAARGGDLLFLKALHQLGGKTNIVLPLEREVFERVSVDDGTPKWRTRYAQALENAASVRVANSHSSTADGTAFEYGTRHLLGLAKLHARQLDAPLKALVLWNGEAGEGHGGTAWAVAHLLKLGVAVENIFPGREGIVTAPPPPSTATEDEQRPIRAILFSDCKGYSKLREEAVVEYTKLFLKGVRLMIDRAADAGNAPAESNTWGDGLFLSFSDVRAAARFATDLRAAALRTGLTLDLPDGVSLRIGLHAGPVTPFTDPITGRPNLAGTNVAFAARIEPIVHANQICVSEPFAALAADEGLDEFRFEYAGITEFAKGFGKHPLYRLISR